jgi:Na+-transporting NADH:ubiquinone oxidoreductase subunit F
MIKDQCPAPYPNLYSTYREIIPAVRRQLTDPSFFVRRPLPAETTLSGGDSGFEQLVA